MITLELAILESIILMGGYAVRSVIEAEAGRLFRLSALFRDVYIASNRTKTMMIYNRLICTQMDDPDDDRSTTSCAAAATYFL